VIKESEAKNVEMKAKLESETQIADSKRKYEIQASAFAQEVNARNAEAELAGTLQSAKENKKIKEETMQIGVVERKKQILIEEQEVKRKEKELESTVKKPAEAERIKLETLAEANMKKTILEAEGSADAKLMMGEAEANVLRTKGEAEAFKMSSKAEAWKAYSEVRLFLPHASHFCIPFCLFF
jgi:flotillin